MNVSRHVDGSLQIHENFALLRWGLLWCAGFAAFGAVVDQISSVDLLRGRPERLTALGVAVVCGLGALWAPSLYIRFDGPSKTLRYRRRSLLGVTTQVFPFSAVQGVRVEQQVTREEATRPMSAYRVWIDTSQSSLPLSLVDSFIKEDCEKLAQEVRGVLEIDESSDHPPLRNPVRWT